MFSAESDKDTGGCGVTHSPVSYLRVLYSLLYYGKNRNTGGTRRRLPGGAMEQLEGYVERITYRNQESGYTVMTLHTEGDSVCVTGSFAELSEGEFVRVRGEMIVHPVYGEQMKAETLEFTAPGDVTQIERYLGSGAIRGVGPKLAKRITDMFGEDTLRILEEEPERLSEVKGISERSAMEIAEQVISKREARSAMMFLQGYHISPKLSARIYKEYGNRVYTVLRENPYRLAEDIDGVGFKTADEIAMKAGIRPDSAFRVRCGVVYLLRQAAGYGHTFYPRDELVRLSEELLGVTLSDFDSILQDLLMERRIVIRNTEPGKPVYLAQFYRMESETARMLADMNICDQSIPEEEIRGNIAGLEKESSLTLAPDQRRAVEEAVKNGITIITGGPGTGKTTIINMIIRYFIREGLDIMLAAPTGRAAKRMTEATGFESQTIHRLLEVNGDPSENGRSHFARNEDLPLETDVVIIDEMSMVDIMLMHALLKAMVPGMRLVLVGDVDQLPSVGPGEVLRDLIRSDVFPVVKLTQIFRQAERSDIVVNAHKINDGEVVEPKRSEDFLFILRDQVGQITGACITLLREKLPKYCSCSPSEIQVLTPMRKGALGVENLNKVLQEALNPPSARKLEKEFSFGIFREGDKVMQIKNDYQLEWEMEGTFPRERGTGVFNGETGIIKLISLFDETITVLFEDGRVVAYPFSAADELELAYAVTIHKSQGSEYPAVILPLFAGPQLLMTRNLLYTGITRAKSCVCIVGRYDTFKNMILNNQEQRRYSGLRELIEACCGFTESPGKE